MQRPRLVFAWPVTLAPDGAWAGEIAAKIPGRG